FDGYPELRMLDAAMSNEVAHFACDKIDRDGEANTYTTSRRTDDSAVDADEPPVEIDECPARVAGIDRGIGLNEIFVPFDTQPCASQGADDAHGGSLPKAEWIA